MSKLAARPRQRGFSLPVTNSRIRHTARLNNVNKSLKGQRHAASTPHRLLWLTVKSNW